ncbi:hypothetical protein [Micromonospora sediminimaris]|nr:hypothetical protein [Micromonospora sediminimaris]
MDVAIVTNAVVAAVSVITVGVSVFFALRQLRLSQSANHTLVAIELLTRDRMSDAFLDSQQFVLTELRARCSPELRVSDLPSDARKHVNRIALYYNGLGQMLAFNVVDPALLIGTGGFRAREAWSVLESYILAERAARGESYLASRRARHRDAVVGCGAQAGPTPVRQLSRRPGPGDRGGRRGWEGAGRRFGQRTRRQLGGLRLTTTATS